MLWVTICSDRAWRMLSVMKRFSLETMAEFSKVFTLFVDGVHVFYRVTGRISKDVSKHFHLELRSCCVKGQMEVKGFYLVIVLTTTVSLRAASVMPSRSHCQFYYFNNNIWQVLPCQQEVLQHFWENSLTIWYLKPSQTQCMISKLFILKMGRFSIMPVDVTVLGINLGDSRYSFERMWMQNKAFLHTNISKSLLCSFLFRSEV